MSEAGPAAPCALVVMGVSGSGKTTVAMLLAQRLGWVFEDADSLHPPANVEKMHAGIPLDDADRAPWLRAVAAEIGSWLDSGRSGVMACSALKRAYRDTIRDGRANVRFVYLKGDPALIARRLTIRHNHFMPPTLLGSQFETLEEPGSDEQPIVVGIEGTPGEIVDQALAGLPDVCRTPSPSG